MPPFYIFTLILLLLLTVFSMSLLGISAHLLAWTSSHTSQTFAAPGYTFHYTPQNNRSRSYILLLTTGCIVTILSISSFLALSTLRSFKLSIPNQHSPRKIPPTPILVTCTILSTILTLSALALSFTDFSLNPAFLPCAGSWQSCSQSLGIANPAYTIEGWACPLSRDRTYIGSISGLALAELGGICTEAQVVRWWTVAMLILELSVAICGLVMLWKRNIQRRRTMSESNEQVWDDAGDEKQIEAGKDQDATGGYESRVPALSEQNGQLFSPVSPVSPIDDGSQQKGGFVHSVSHQTNRETQPVPRYEPRDYGIHEAEARERQVYEVEATAQRPPQPPAGRARGLNELPAEKPIR